MKPFARMKLSSAALRRGEGNVKMCKYPISNIQYPVSNIQYPISSIHYPMIAGQIGYWLLAVGYLHISTFNKKGATHETLCTNQLVLSFILRSLGEGGRSA